MSLKMMDGTGFMRIISRISWLIINGTQPYGCMTDFNYLSSVMKLFIALGLEVQAVGAYDARKHGRKR